MSSGGPSLASLQAQITALQQQMQQVMAAAQGGETLQPTYLTVSPAGLVSAEFSGIVSALGITLPVYIGGGSPGPPNKVAWTRQASPDDNALIAWLQASTLAGTGNPVGALLGVEPPDATNPTLINLIAYGQTISSYLTIAANTAAGDNSVSACAGAHLETLINDEGQSSFLQLGSAQRSIVGGTNCTWPGGSYSSNTVTVSLPGATGAVQGIATANTRSDGGGPVMVAVETLNDGAADITCLAPQGVGEPGVGVNCGVYYLLWGD